MTVDEWKSRAAQVGCVVCAKSGRRGVPATLHHPREGQGMSQRASDWLVVALCPEHHQGKTGWEGLGKRGFYLRYLMDEMDLLALTIKGIASKL